MVSAILRLGCKSKGPIGVKTLAIRRHLTRLICLAPTALILFAFLLITQYAMLTSIVGEMGFAPKPLNRYALQVRDSCGYSEITASGFGAQLKRSLLSASGYHLPVFNKVSPAIGHEHELLRRRAARMAKEIWLVSQAEYPPPNSVVLSPSSKQKTGQVTYNMSNPFRKYLTTVALSLMAHLDRLGQADGVQIQRANQLNDLHCLVASRLLKLQNPPVCSKAKLLLVDLHPDKGLACQVHNFMFCLQLAYATGRTMLLRPKDHSFQNWWVENFEPFSNKCNEASFAGEGAVPDLDLPTLYSDIRVLYCRYELCYKSKQIPIAPPAVPSDMASMLQNLHGQPGAWFAGQLAQYVFRPRETLKKHVDEAKALFGIETPGRPAIVGVHVRRTDKITWGEGGRHPFKNYMTHVSRYFDLLEEQRRTQVVTEEAVESNDTRWYENATTGPRTMFIATDDPTVFEEAKTYSSRFTILGSQERASSAAVEKRKEELSRRNAVADIFILSQTDFIVCTLSSHLCRLA
ncbi:unnamed protein product [Calicophoron daubneyi]|uniref:GT23 domain-containing protein n=1 Tax=Calicophoron daubneyi TaxID=300641 RepID=A0AAV2U0U6_CALDB